MKKKRDEEDDPLFRYGEAHARNSDPDTSKAGAEHVQGAKANEMEQEVLGALRKHGDLTNHDLVRLTGIPWNTITPRVRPLVNKGLVFDSGRKRPGPAGVGCIVWTLNKPQK